MKEIIKLNTNENPYKMCIKNIEINPSLNRYPDEEAMGLKKAYSQYSGIPVEKLMCGNGSDELIDLAFATFAKNKTVVGLDPDFSMYDVYAKKYQTRLLKTVEQDLEELKVLAVRSSAAMIVLSNPNNPTGKVYDAQSIEKLLLAFNGVVLVDEAYVEFGGDSVIDLLMHFDRLLVTRTCSKALGMAALRIGFVAGSESLLKQMNALRSPYNVNTLSQVLGEIFLKDRASIVKGIEKVMKNRDLLLKKLETLEKLYGGFELSYGAGNYVYLKTLKAKEWENLFRENGIWVRCFEKGLRISVGSIQEVEFFLNVFEKILGGEGYE